MAIIRLKELSLTTSCSEAAKGSNELAEVLSVFSRDGFIASSLPGFDPSFMSYLIQV